MSPVQRGHRKRCQAVNWCRHPIGDISVHLALQQVFQIVQIKALRGRLQLIAYPLRGKRDILDHVADFVGFGTEFQRKAPARVVAVALAFIRHAHAVQHHTVTGASALATAGILKG